MADKQPSQADVNEAMGINTTPDGNEFDKNYAKRVLDNATKEQKDTARKELNVMTRSGGGNMRSYRGYRDARQG
jgi:hypothetical protein